MSTIIKHKNILGAPGQSNPELFNYSVGGPGCSRTGCRAAAAGERLVRRGRPRQH